MIKLVKYFLLLIAGCIPGLVIANSYSAINYTITPVFTSNVPYIKVDAEIKGQLSGKVVVDLPYKWAHVKYYQQIKNVKLNHPHGKIQLKKHAVNQAVITTSKTNSLSLSYEVYQKSGDPTCVEEAIIRKNLIHAPGYGILAVPNELKAPENEKIEFKVVWKTLPKQWKTLSSHGPNKSLKFVTDAQKLLHSIYMAGNLRIYQIADSNSPIYLSFHGKFDLQDDLIASNLCEIIKTQRTFFNDYDFTCYVISLIQGSDPHSGGGTGLYNSFAAHLPKGMEKINYYKLLAHEHFHSWTGGKIRNNEQEVLNYWWTEGFTEYYSRVLALRSNGLSIEEFINECNQFLRDYYLSPVLNAPNRRIKHAFWKDHDIQRLPYNRGFIFAIYLNSLIKKNNPDNSLDNVMLDLFKNSVHKKFSTPYFQSLIKAYISRGITQETAMYIDKGKTIELSDAAKLLPIEKRMTGAFDIGFDELAFAKEKVIKKIDEKSNAYEVGLRNGDKIVGWSLPKGRDPDQIATIKTADKVFKFRPGGSNKKNIYQFKSNLSQADKIKIKKFFGVK